MAVATPKKPRPTPTALRSVSRSSRKASAATSTPKIAVEALRIAASPVSMLCWPQVMSVKGRALFSNPMTKSAPQVLTLRGGRYPIGRSTAQSTSAAPAMRIATTVRTGVSATATLIDRKEPPQIRARRPIWSQAESGMVFCCMMA